MPEFLLTCNIHPPGRPEPFQMQFQLDPDLFSHQVLMGTCRGAHLFEHATSRLIIEALGPGDQFIDAGAFIGWFSVLGGKLVGPQGRGWSFEPETANHQRLLAHLRLNGIDNVIPHAWAIGDRTGIAELFLNPHNDGGHATWNLAVIPNYRMDPQTAPRRHVYTVTLDEMFLLHPPGSIAMIKVDTEGTEMEVLEGGRGMLQRVGVPLVICEINRSLLKAHGRSEAEMHRLMRGLGYEIYMDNSLNGTIVHLPEGQSLKADYVYNLFFVRPELAQRLKLQEKARPAELAPLM